MAVDYSHSFCFTVMFWRVFLHPCVCVRKHSFGTLHKSDTSPIRTLSPVLSHKRRKGIFSISSAAFHFGVAFSDCPSPAGQHEGTLKARVPCDDDRQKNRPMLTFEIYCHKVTATALPSTSSPSFLHPSPQLHLISIWLFTR